MLHPSERALRWRLLGDFRPISIEPKVSDFKGERLVEFEESAWYRGFDPNPSFPSITCQPA